MPRGLLTYSSAAVLIALGAYYYAPSFLEMSTCLDALIGEGPLADSPPPPPASASASAGRRHTSLASSAGEFAAQEFDYVVVGGGTAGLVVAARLSEDERVRVGVLEAGGYVAPGEEPRIDLIVNYGLVFGDPKFDWNLKSVPQEGLDGRVVQETV
jgi:GMC oxidoreductase